ncbi:MAG: methyltransferase regulatory domain-containing protein [Pseudomonadota bacterium]
MTQDLGGYFDEESYPAQLTYKMTPGWLWALALRHGWRAPDPSGAFRMLDIGCGDGVALAAIAASHPESTVEGIDGMAEHIVRGRAFARGITNLELAHALFGEALKDGGLPCDFVTAHGVLAWVAPEIRAEALDLAAARLAPGGICAVSYNALPGWSDRLAYQHIIRQFAATGEGSGTERYFAAHERTRELAEAGLTTVPMNVVEFFDDVATKAPPDYFPHEFLAGGWQPLWGADVRREMAARGLVYLGQAEFERARADLALRPGPREVVEKAGSPDLRDTLFDLALNAPFRIDLYGRAPRRAEDDTFGQVWFRARKDADAALAGRTTAGSIRFDNPAARALLEALQGGPQMLATLAEDLRLGLPDVLNAADCLVLGRIAEPCAPLAGDMAAVAFNARLSRAALTPDGTAIDVLATPFGPVKAKPMEIALLAHTPKELLAAAQQQPVVATRFLQDGVAPNDPSVEPELTIAKDEVRRRLARVGVPVVPESPSL